MKRLLFVQSAPPHGSVTGQEALDAILMGSAFAECGLLFVADGVFQILKDQSTEALGTKNYARSYGALKDYGVTNIYCRRSDLQTRGLDAEMLSLTVNILNDQQAAKLLDDYEVVVNF